MAPSQPTQSAKVGTSEDRVSRPAPRATDFSLYLITDRHLVAAGHTLFSALESALQGGVRAIQLREKDLAVDDLRPMARELRRLTSAYGAKFLINHHVELALEVAADGVHLGGHSMPVDAVRERVGPGMLIGASTHAPAEISDAAQRGADFVTFGPVYATPSKAAYGAPQGLTALAEACRASSLPVYALGGVTAARVPEIAAAGASGIALISAIIAAPSPKIAAQAFIT